MITINVLLGFLIVLITSVGQIFLKIGANKGGRLIFNRYVISGYICFLSVIFLSAIIMKSIDFKYFTVIVSLNYLGATLMAIFILKEEVTWNKILGCIFISFGAVIFSL